MIETAVLNPLIYDAFVGKTTWLQTSKAYPVEEWVATFYVTRAAMQRTLADLTDAQAAFSTNTHPFWSLSETVTHLVYSQNGYYNWLIDITDVFTPHVLEAAKGFGEGAQVSRPADELRSLLTAATDRIRQMLDQTLPTHDPLRVVSNPLFGQVNYPTLVLLLLAHEVDHVRQAILMRRLSRNFTDRDVSLPVNQPPSS